jgi:chromosome segregation ATPase
MAREVNDKINQFELGIISNLKKIEDLKEETKEIKQKMKQIEERYMETLKAYTGFKELQEKELKVLLKNDKIYQELKEKLSKIEKEIKNTLLINKQLKANIRYKKEVLELLKLEIKSLIGKND